MERQVWGGVRQSLGGFPTQPELFSKRRTHLAATHVIFWDTGTMSHQHPLTIFARERACPCFLNRPCNRCVYVYLLSMFCICLYIN
uniref:Uncharacterized protein n=1 Tax=Anguilla anguilla TaxID=7936 RepID=A0A0E9WQ63_ANGAN